jgi:hypothetical protein
MALQAMVRQQLLISQGMSLEDARVKVEEEARTKMLEQAAYAQWPSWSAYQAESPTWAQQAVSAPNYVPQRAYAQDQARRAAWAQQAVSAPNYVPQGAHAPDQAHVIREHEDRAAQIYAQAQSQANKIIIDANLYATQIIDDSRIRAEAFQAAEVAAKNALEETLQEMALVRRKIEIMKLNPEEYF